MELWLRFTNARALEWDENVTVDSQVEWERIVAEARPVSSILWPSTPLFPVRPRHPAQAFQRRHPHEKNYANDPGRNASYRDACRKLAGQVAPILAEARTLVYAPLRGAWPIWKAVSCFLPPPLPDVYFPVTSSFVSYPESWEMRNDKGRPGSGRLAHRLELARLLPLLEAYRQVVYLDEIVSGGVMAAYLDEFVRLGIPGRLRVVAAGIADDFGRRSQAKRARIGALVDSGVLRGLLWEGCSALITEDNKFLLGIHYTDYRAGMNVVPVLTESLAEWPEKTQFDREVMATEKPAAGDRGGC